MLLVIGCLWPPSRGYAQTLSWDDAQLRMGFHASTPLHEENSVGPKVVTHLMIPNVPEWTPPWIYLGVKVPLREHWWGEVYAGAGLDPEQMTPAPSVRIEGTPGRFYFWLDVEYYPLFDHTLFGAVIAHVHLGSVFAGFESENWTSITNGSPYGSAGPTIGAPIGDHVFLATTTFITSDGTVFQRGHFHLVF